MAKAVRQYNTSAFRLPPEIERALKRLALPPDVAQRFRELFAWSPDTARRLPPELVQAVEETVTAQQPASKSSPEELRLKWPKEWLFDEFDRVPCPADGQDEYLKDACERINKDKSVRRRPLKPITLKTVQNRYAEWKKVPKKRK
jgi:hypothetical protein